MSSQSAPILSVGTITGSEIYVSWTGATNATSFSYMIDGVEDTGASFGPSAARFANLTPLTGYNITVVATYTDSEGATVSVPSTTVSLTTLQPVPTKPHGSENVSVRSAGTFTIEWTGGDGATSYTYSLDGSGATPSNDNGFSLKSAIFIDSSGGGTYTVIITATNEYGSTSSDPFTATSGNGKGDGSQITNIEEIYVDNVSATGFTLHWQGGQYTGNENSLTYAYLLGDSIANGEYITPSSSSLIVAPFYATFTGLSLTNSLYYITFTIGSTLIGVGQVSNAVSFTVTQVDPPTQPVVTVGTVTGTTVSLSWTGGNNATSYTYTLNGTSATPTNNNVSGKSATFTGLSASTAYAIIVTAVNSGGNAASSSVSTTTSAPPAAPTAEAITELKDTFNSAIIAAGSGSSEAEQLQAASSAIIAAIAANVAPATLVAAALTASISSPAVLTALVDSPVFIGATISVPSAVAQTLYASFAVQTIDTTLPLTVNFPAADGSVTAPAAGANSKLAIDLNGTDKYVPFRGTTGYGIRLTNGVQRFVTPTDVSGTVVSTGDVITFTLTGGATLSFTVADLDIVLAPYTAPPSIVCFLGSAPVLTPSGYRRIDRIELGDLVCTPTGTAKVEAIKKQSYKASKFTNPYVIPEGTYNANRRLLISPRHKVAVNGKMIEAKDLGLEQEAQKGDIIYYNLQITKTSNMIVAGVEVESLAPLVRITISREAFNYILTTRHGGVLTEEIKSKCRFLPDGTVSVPSIKH
jgi:hypothetical protein